MKVWLIDDEQPCLDEMTWSLKQYHNIEVAGADTDPQEALSSIVLNRPDAVFMDIDMPKLHGLELALHIQEQCPGAVIVFVTAYAQYALEAYKAHPMDFLLKPVRRARLDDCIAHLYKQYALLHPEGKKNSLYIRCFGMLELECDVEIKWGTRRVKELMLYLISRNGSPATRVELLEVLFGGQEDKNTVHNLYMTIYRLRSLLDTIDPERRLIRLTGDNSIIPAPGVCDFTDFLAFAHENAVITGENAEGAAHALSLCRGIFLEKESFEWISEYMYEVEAEYERIALGLANFYIADGCPEQAEKCLITLLLRNALCEDAHALLLDITLESGSREAYLGRYEQYARILKKELHTRPDPYYSKQYEHLKY